MNKIYGIIAIFAFAGLLLPTSAMQVEAESDLDYMLNIAEKAKRYIKHNIDEMENSNTQDWKNRQAVLEIYKKRRFTKKVPMRLINYQMQSKMGM